MKSSLLALVAAAVVVLAVGGAARATCPPPQRGFAEATMIVEVNATDGDAAPGLPRRRAVEVDERDRPRRPHDPRRHDEGATRRLRLTELFSESSEPPFDVFPLEKFKQLFPAGRYSFVGRTIEGARLTGCRGSRMPSRRGRGSSRPRTDLGSAEPASSVAGRSGAQRAGADIVAYRAIVTTETPRPRVFSADLPPPPRDTSRSREPSSPHAASTSSRCRRSSEGNQTLTEVSFRVR